MIVMTELTCVKVMMVMKAMATGIMSFFLNVNLLSYSHNAAPITSIAITIPDNIVGFSKTGFPSR